MSEDRIAALEARVYQQHAEIAALSSSVEHLADAVAKLTVVAQDLRDNMNRGRGALWVFGTMAGTLGGVIAWATTLLFRQN